MKKFHFAIQPRSPRFYLNMLNSQALEMSMKLGSKFMAIIGTNGMDLEGEFGNHIINKIYGILL